jgi:hypothetical protein
MVGHHNGIVNDYPEGNSYTCQGIEMHLKFKEIIEDKSNEDVCNKTDCYNKKVFEFTAYKKYEEKKQYN